MQFVGFNSLDFWGCIDFFKNDSSSMLYQTHTNTFINEEKAFGSSPGNAHCENSAKVLMWWPPRNGEIWAPMICKLSVLKTLVDLISCAFGMNFLSKCKKKNISSAWRKKKDPSRKRICTSTSFLGRVCCRPWCSIKRKMWLPRLYLVQREMCVPLGEYPSYGFLNIHPYCLIYAI